MNQNEADGKMVEELVSLVTGIELLIWAEWEILGRVWNLVLFELIELFRR